MQLLIFAHRGEAQHFLSEGEFSPVKFAFDGLYQGEQSFLLITGEGLKSASEKTAAVCGAFFNQITQVLNFGVAGALNNEVEIGNIYSIRSVYADGQFKSYSADQSESLIDCISSTERLFDEKEAIRLSHFAGLVDRELWAIGSIAALFKIPFKAIKLVSDRVGENKEVCQVVKDQAPEYSARLYSYYLENLSQIESSNQFELEILNDKRFYLTTSQTRKYESLLSSLKQKLEKEENEILTLLEIDQICDMQPRPKQRSNLLLNKMQAILNPFQNLVKEKLNYLLEDFHRANLNFKFDESFETDEFTLSTRIQDPKHLEEVIAKLKSFPYEKIQAVLKGDLDV